MSSFESNFACLAEHDEQPVRVGVLAERYFPEDPNTCLLKLRQLAEILAQTAASYAGFYSDPGESQHDLLSRLRDHGILPYEIHQLFGEVRRAGNAANHSLAGDHRIALAMLRITWQLAVWFHRTFREPRFKSGAFIPPKAPPDPGEELEVALSAAREELAKREKARRKQSRQLDEIAGQLAEAHDERSFWEKLASEIEAENRKLQARLAATQATDAGQPATETARIVRAASGAAENILEPGPVRDTHGRLQMTTNGYNLNTSPSTCIDFPDFYAR